MAAGPQPKGVPMAMMLGKLYAALRAGNVPDDMAREAAEEGAKYEKLDARLARIETELMFHRWAFGIMLAMQAAIIIRLFK
jgi:hypothetical protein